MQSNCAGAEGKGRSRSVPETRSYVRRHARFAVYLPVQCVRISSRGTRSWRGRTANVSRGGLALELAERLPPATKVAVEIRTGIGPMRMEADVVWTRRTAGGTGAVRHGLCLANRSDLLDLPVGALLGQWLQRRAVSEKGTSQRRRPSRRRGGRSTA
jgi:hypothetical protein